jgi:hypothetical protein
MQYKINIVLQVLDDIIAIFEEGNICIVAVIIWFIVLFYTYVDIVFIDDFDVLHVFVKNILINLSSFFSKVQKILIITVSDVLYLTTIKQYLPNRWKSFKPVLIKIDFF